MKTKEALAALVKEIEELQKSGAMFVQTPEMAAEHRYEVI